MRWPHSCEPARSLSPWWAQRASGESALRPDGASRRSHCIAGADQLPVNVHASVSGIEQPSVSHAVARLIAGDAGRSMLPNAVALNNAGANFGRLVGPAVAGVLLAVPDIGIGLAFMAMAVMYFAALLTLLRLPAGTRPSSASLVNRPGGAA